MFKGFRLFNGAPKSKEGPKTWGDITFNWAKDPRIEEFFKQMTPEWLKDQSPEMLRKIREQARQIRALMKREEEETDNEATAAVPSHDEYDHGDWEEVDRLGDESIDAYENRKRARNLVLSINTMLEEKETKKAA